MTNDLKQRVTDELKPCPFCGGKAKVVQRGTMRASMIVACTTCAASVESGDVAGLTPVDEWLWNRRLEAALSVSSSGEAVAWRRAHRDEPSEFFDVTTSEEIVAVWHRMGMVVEPLYAHPSPSSVQTGVAVKALEWREPKPAKAAAQADYEHRILSALSSAPAPSVEELRGALIDARLWLNGQPDRSQCSANSLTELLNRIDAALVRNSDAAGEGK